MGLLRAQAPEEAVDEEEAGELARREERVEGEPDIAEYDIC